MASTAGDSLLSSPAAPASAFLDDHHRHPFFFSSSSASSFLDPAATSSPLAALTTTQEPHPPLLPAAAGRKPPRKRPRPSRRPPTTVLTTDASNFRAMVQEFTGFPAPPPYLGPGGVLFGAGTSPSGAAAATGAPPFQLLRPSQLKLPAAPHASRPTCTTSSFAQSLFTNSNVNPAMAPSSRSELYSGFGPALAGGAVPRYDDGLEAATEDERVGHGHGLFSSFLYAGERYQT